MILFKNRILAKISIIGTLLFFGIWAVFLLNLKPETMNIDSRAKPILDQYLKEASIRNYDLINTKISIEITNNLNLVKTKKFVERARCSYFPYPKITIDESFWNKNSDLVREMTLFHELTHCLSLKPHAESDSHIMYFSLSNNITVLYSRYRTEMIDELFNSKNYKMSSYFKEYFYSWKVFLTHKITRTN